MFNSNHKTVAQLSACEKVPDASSAECLIEAKSTYALRSADPGSSRRLTNLCFRIACLIQKLLKTAYIRRIILI